MNSTYPFSSCKVEVFALYLSSLSSHSNQVWSMVMGFGYEKQPSLELTLKV
ncbi:hypothetical protein SLEP1_g46476 [Rubroshorea leprosula]|uniref:Uncharacterized protein n=1 Tax=Rubroshorea leprosula TaxID=152421 RepID=A0AAV5LMG8_9ROSI|nr:hypothetical protein SLEP1_g46476 [Rubroshorea leprosula]